MSQLNQAVLNAQQFVRDLELTPTPILWRQPLLDHAGNIGFLVSYQHETIRVIRLHVPDQTTTPDLRHFHRVMIDETTYIWFFGVDIAKAALSQSTQTTANLQALINHLVEMTASNTAVLCINAEFYQNSLILPVHIAQEQPIILEHAQAVQHTLQQWKITKAFKQFQTQIGIALQSGITKQQLIEMIDGHARSDQ